MKFPERHRMIHASVWAPVRPSPFRVLPQSFGVRGEPIKVRSHPCWVDVVLLWCLGDSHQLERIEGSVRFSYFVTRPLGNITGASEHLGMLNDVFKQVAQILGAVLFVHLSTHEHQRSANVILRDPIKNESALGGQIGIGVKDRSHESKQFMTPTLVYLFVTDSPDDSRPRSMSVVTGRGSG